MQYSDATFTINYATKTLTTLDVGVYPPTQKKRNKSG